MVACARAFMCLCLRSVGCLAALQFGFVGTIEPMCACAWVRVRVRVLLLMHVRIVWPFLVAAAHRYIPVSTCSRVVYLYCCTADALEL